MLEGRHRGGHTGSILAPANLDELLDVAHFAGHAGRAVGVFVEGSGGELSWVADGGNPFDAVGSSLCALGEAGRDFSGRCMPQSRADVVPLLTWVLLLMPVCHRCRRQSYELNSRST